jgi:hypothetical protein
MKESRQKGISTAANHIGSRVKNLGAESWQKTKTWSSKKNQNRPDLAQKAEPTTRAKN